MASATEGTATKSSFNSEEVSKLMGQGKRHLVCSEVVQAVKCFEEATQKLDDKYGSGADECGEAYLYYGKALLELARAENGVLGNALKDADLDPKSEESSDEEEEKMGTVGPKIKEMSKTDKEKVREDVQDAMAAEKEGKNEDKNKEDKGEGATKENKKESETKSEETTSTETTVEEKKKEEKASEKDEKESKEATEVKEGGKDDKEEGKEKGKDGEEEEEEGEDEEMETEEGEGDGEGDEQGEGEDAGADANAEEQEEDGDVPTMQLAWEFLELARLVFLRNEKEAQLNLAEVLLKLGEIKLEQEQFSEAAVEFQKCLDIQMKNLEPDNRLIAETAYNMGLAYSLVPNYAKSKEFFCQALDVITLKIKKLEARIAESESKSKGKGKATDDNPCVVDRKELEELKNLYPEIKARVDDAQEMINSAATKAESTTEEGFGSSELEKSDAPASSIPVKQTATLIPVRRKRKPDEEESGSAVTQDTEAPVKKARQEEEKPAAPVVTENGHGVTG